MKYDLISIIFIKNYGIIAFQLLIIEINLFSHLYSDFIILLSYSFRVIMSSSIEKCVLDIPDEILEDKFLTLLPLNDLMNLMIIGKARLFHCGYAVIKKKFSSCK